MKNLFVPYELAVIAKEKGFTEPCLACFDEPEIKATYSHVFKPLNYNVGGSHKISAPLYQQILDWFREKHKIDIWIETIYENDKQPIRYFIQCPQLVDKEVKFNPWTNSYHEALNKAIKEAFKLIKPL